MISARSASFGRKRFAGSNDASIDELFNLAGGFDPLSISPFAKGEIKKESPFEGGDFLSLPSYEGGRVGVGG